MPPVSVRMRVARSVNGFNLPASMSRDERIDFERTITTALQTLIEDPDYGGQIYSPTSGADTHLMKDISADPYMRSAGISADWPYGRACYVSRNQEAIVWIGEEDHLRIISMRTATKLGDVLDGLHALVDRIAALPGVDFVHDDTFGYVNSCPSNLGTGMRASVRIETPEPVELSPPRRGFMSEPQILDKLFESVRNFASVATIALLLAIWPSAASAQVSIRSVGGLLGYLDGFPEFPAWPGDTFEGNPDLIAQPNPPLDPKRPLPYGGLIGLATYLKSHPVPTSEGVLLISGNNHPQHIDALHDARVRNEANAIPAAASHWFWKPLIDLHPDAVGVGTEDVHRWLTQMRPEHLVSWIKDGNAAGLPLVASNVIIRLRDPHLNVARDSEHQIAIDIPEDESLDFIDSIRLTHTCGTRDRVRAATFMFDAGPAIAVMPPGANELSTERESAANRARRAVLGDVCHTTLRLAERLRPGTTYRLRSSLSAPSFRFTLTTHAVLTPLAAFAGLPVAGVTRGGAAMAIMGFVSPTASRRVPPEYFEWDKADGCAAAHCRLEIVNPETAARELIDLIAPPHQPAPMLLAMANMLEAETTAFLDAVPEVRFVAVSPDSGRLGRAAPAIDASAVPYSGDRGFGAIVDRQQPDLAKIIVRPTWLGEYIHTAVATLRATGPGAAWQIKDASLSFEAIPGASLGWTIASDGIHYTAALDPTRFRNTAAPVRASSRIFQPYCSIDADGPFDAMTRQRQGDLWTNPVSFAGLVLDEMRRSARADISLVPQSWIDPDVIATIATPPSAGVPPLSGFMLQRILYRSQGVVRVAIEGSELAERLAAIVGTTTAAKDPVCISGLGLAGVCPLTSIDVEELLVNVRRPEDGNYYRVALPVTLAREAALSYDESAPRDLLVDLDARLSACKPLTPSTLLPASDPLAERLEHQLARRAQHYVKIDPLTIDLAATSVREANSRDGLFSQLPIDGAGEQASRRIAIDGEIDAVLWDTAAYAVRTPAELRYDRTTVDQETSYDRDEFSIGFRVDRKRLPARWARLYAGVFFDGRLFDRQQSVDAPEGVSSITIAPQRNVGVGYGLEVPQARFGRLTIDSLQVTHFIGQAYNIPIALRAGSQRYETATRRQSRVQIDARTDTTLPLASSPTLSTEHRYRWYQHDASKAGLFTTRSFYTKVSLDVGVAKRWTVGPYVEHNAVVAAMNGVADQHFSATSWGAQVKVPIFWNGRSIQ